MNANQLNASLMHHIRHFFERGGSKTRRSPVPSRQMVEHAVVLFEVCHASERVYRKFLGSPRPQLGEHGATIGSGC